MDRVSDSKMHSKEPNFRESSDRNGNDHRRPSQLSIEKNNENVETEVYTTRILMLLVVFAFNMTNGALWISFSTTADSTKKYFQVSDSQVNWFLLVFLIVPVPTMCFTLWFIHRFGFKPSIIVGLVLNSIGSLIRLISTLPGIDDENRYPIAMTGQVIAALAQPFAISLHTKVSQIWFPSHRRTLATGLAAMAQPAGFVIASVVFPAIVDEKEDIPTANYVICGMGIAAGFCALAVRHSKPPKPPSISAAAKANENTKQTSYASDLCQLVKKKDFMILALAIGGGMGMICALNMLIVHLLCPVGYDSDIAELCKALIVLVGFVGGGIYTEISERTRFTLEEIIKVGFTFAVIVAIILTMVNGFITGAKLAVIKTESDVTWVVCLLCAIFGLFAMGCYPVVAECAVEAIYPLDESYAAGMMIFLGEIHGIVFVFVMRALEQHIDAEDKAREVCSEEDPPIEPKDMTYSAIFLTAYAVILTVIMLLFFKPKYHRKEFENPKRPVVRDNYA